MNGPNIVEGPFFHGRYSTMCTHTHCGVVLPVSVEGAVFVADNQQQLDEGVANEICRSIEEFVMHTDPLSGMGIRVQAQYCNEVMDDGSFLVVIHVNDANLAHMVLMAFQNVWDL